MEIQRRLTVASTAEHVFAFVDNLSRYPEWMDLAHEVVSLESTSSGELAWEVELRARVGPLARSKRLRMVRTHCDAPWAARFERAEIDGRAHAPWVLDARIEPDANEPGATEPGATEPSAPDQVVLTMTLTYGGSLWTGAVLQRVFDDEVRRGSDKLVELVSSEPTR